MRAIVLAFVVCLVGCLKPTADDCTKSANKFIELKSSSQPHPESPSMRAKVMADMLCWTAIRTEEHGHAREQIGCQDDASTEAELFRCAGLAVMASSGRPREIEIGMQTFRCYMKTKSVEALADCDARMRDALRAKYGH